MKYHLYQSAYRWHNHLTYIIAITTNIPSHIRLWVWVINRQWSLRVDCSLHWWTCTGAHYIRLSNIPSLQLLNFFSFLFFIIFLLLWILFVLYSNLTFILIHSLCLSTILIICIIFYLYFSEMGDRIALQYGGSEAHKKVNYHLLLPFLIYTIPSHPVPCRTSPTNPNTLHPIPYTLYVRLSLYHTNFLYLLLF